MPWNEADASDPNVLVGVTLPADAVTVRDMAWVFAEEFARLGFDTRRILGLFRTPFYASAHAALRALGDAEIAAIVDECVWAWGRRTASPKGD
jgi:hypothetical protein